MTATNPEDLGRLFFERASAGDVDGLVALYEPDAVLDFPPGQVRRGHKEIREAYEDFVAAKPMLPPGEPRPAFGDGELAITSTRLANGTITVEVARRQPDGSWLWVLDQPGFASLD